MLEHTKFERLVGNILLGMWLFGILLLFISGPIGIITFILTKDYVYEISITITFFVCLISTILIIVFDKRKLKNRISS